MRDAAARSAGWRRALAFLRAWTAPDSPLHRAVAVVWLEFDVSEDGSFSEPFLVFTLDPERLLRERKSGSSRPGCDASRPAWISWPTVSIAATAQAVSRCVKALPRAGSSFTPRCAPHQRATSRV